MKVHCAGRVDDDDESTEVREVFALETFRPLAVLLPERSTPELAYLQAKFAALAATG